MHKIITYSASAHVNSVNNFKKVEIFINNICFYIKILLR